MELKNTLKIFFGLFIAFVLFGLTVAGALAQETYSYKGSFDISSERRPSLLPLSFAYKAPVAENSRICSATIIKSPVIELNRGKTSAFQYGGTGTLCSNGDYIRYFYCSDNSLNCQSKKDMFEHLWFKSSNSDTPDFTRYWTVQQEKMYISYQCYECKIDGEPVSTYTCYDSKYRGEHGTIYYGVEGVCDNGCKISATGIKTKDQTEIKNVLCADKKVEAEQGQNGTNIVNIVNVNIVQENNKKEQAGSALSGKFTSVIIPPRIEAGEYYTVEAVFEAETAGNYYLEAGLSEEKTLAVVNAEGSKCDGDKHWAGEWVNLKAGESVTMNFKLLAREESAKYNFVIGAYTGCLKEDGKELAIGSQIVDVFGKGEYLTRIANITQGKETSWTYLFWALSALLVAAGAYLIYIGLLYYGFATAIVGLLVFIFAL